MSSLLDCELETAEKPQPECETVSIRVSDLQASEKTIGRSEVRLVGFSLTRTDWNIEKPVFECTEKCGIFDLIESIPRVTSKMFFYLSDIIRSARLLLTTCDYNQK